MKNFIVIISFVLFSSLLNAMSLNDALMVAAKNALEFNEDNYMEKKASSDINKINAAFDYQLYTNLKFIDDKSEQTSAMMGDSRKIENIELGIKKFMSSGTSINFSISQNKTDIKFDNSGSDVATSPIPTAVPSPNASTQLFRPSVNPAYETKYELFINQELWRNFGAKEISLKKQIASLAEILPRYQKKINMQIIKAKTEVLYWNLQAINEQIDIQKKILAKTREFSRLMSLRVKLGRADNVDKAAAESNVIAVETELLKLQIAQKKLKNKFLIRLDPNMSSKLRVFPLTTKLETPPPGLVLVGREAAMNYALQHRYDLKMLAEQIRPLKAKKLLAHEEKKPSISFFAGASISGLEEAAEDSWKENHKAKNPTYLYGLKFEVIPGKTGPKAEVLSAQYEIAVIHSKMDIIRRDLKESLLSIYEDIEGAQKLISLVDKQIISFKLKQHEEEIKLKQARSERIAVIRYEIEVLSAKKSRISAYKQKREAEAQLRLALHGYKG